MTYFNNDIFSSKNYCKNLPEVPCISAGWSKTGRHAYLISGEEITSILSTYEDNCFNFSGIYNTKFDKKRLSLELRKITSSNRLAIIIFINDKKYQHWVALLITKKTLLYFDSDANVDIIINYIDKFVSFIKSEIPTISEFTYNNIDIQMDNINCGYFSIDFLLSVQSEDEYSSWINKYIVKMKSEDPKKYSNCITELRKKYFITDN